MLRADLYTELLNHPAPTLPTADDSQVQVNVDPSLQTVREKIQKLRAADFDHQSKPGDVVVKHHLSGTANHNPVNPYEPQIQALRYLQGGLLISENQAGSGALLLDINKIYQTYLQREANIKSIKQAAQNTHLFADELAKLLVTHKISSNIVKARKQVTMARDLGILLEQRPSVVTISEMPSKQAGMTQVTIQRSSPFKVSPAYYNQEFKQVKDKVWFQKAKHSAGLTQDHSWLDHFFENNFSDLRALGHPAPPSARWLPLPANNQTIEVVTAEKRNGSDSLEQTSYSRFTRMGITSAFAIGSVKEQERLAKAQLKEVLYSQLHAAIENYKDKYSELIQAGAPADFFVDYQTLLTPHYFESSAYKLLKDNNAKFVEMAKQAMHEVKEQLAQENHVKPSADGSVRLHGVNIHFSQTNAAVNKRSSWITAKLFPEEKIEREKKLQSTGALLDKAIGNTKYVQYIQGKGKASPELEASMQRQAGILEGNIPATQRSQPITDISPELQKELAVRLRAAFYLRQLLNKEAPFKDLNTYRRNIMMAALEFHAQGSQAVTMMGCKSARDRTAVAASAIEAMQKDPNAMANWDVLEKHIVSSLHQGHHFRSMWSSMAAAKVSDVHGYFAKQLHPKVQTEISAVKIFAKRLPEFAAKKADYIKHTMWHDHSNQQSKRSSMQNDIKPKR